MSGRWRFSIALNTSRIGPMARRISMRMLRRRKNQRLHRLWLRREDALLDLIDTLLEPVNQRKKRIDHRVSDRIKHKVGATLHEVWRLVHALPDGGDGGAIMILNGDEAACH